METRQVKIVRLTPGMIAFSFQGKALCVGGEALLKSGMGVSDYCVYMSTMVKSEEREVVRFDEAELHVIRTGLELEFKDRGMTVEFFA